MLSTPEKTLTPTKGEVSYKDTPVDVKLVLSSLWATILFVFAYVDIFGFFRADMLNNALDGKLGTSPFEVTQGSLVGTTVYILLPSLMVVLSLVLRPGVNRIMNIAMAVVYSLTIVAGCFSESWHYYLVGSAVEVVLLLVIVRTAYKWPRA